MDSQDFLHLNSDALKQIELSSKQIYLIETYLKLSAQIGVEQVTLKKLAEAANVALGSVHYQFSGKNLELIDMAMRYVDQESVRFINYYLEKKVHSKKFKGMDDYIETLFEWAKQFPHHSQFYLFFYYHSSVHEKYAALNEQYINLMKKRMNALLLTSQERKIYPVIKKLHKLVEEIHAHVYGNLVLCAIDPRADSLKHYEKVSSRGVNNLIKHYS